MCGLENDEDAPGRPNENANGKSMHTATKGATHAWGMRKLSVHRPSPSSSPAASSPSPLRDGRARTIFIEMGEMMMD